MIKNLVIRGPENRKKQKFGELAVRDGRGSWPRKCARILP